MEVKGKAKSNVRIVEYLAYKRGIDIRNQLKLVTRGARHMTLGWRLRNPLQLDDFLRLANPVALQTATPVVIAQRRPDTPGLITFQFELSSGYWQTYTRAAVEGLGVGLGERLEGKKPKQIDFSFDDAPHCLVAGSTRCGKSVTVASILTGLCEVYSPDQLKLVVIDPDYDYEPFDNVSHLALPIAREQEQIDKALLWAGQQQAERKEHNAKNLHRLLVVIDEAASSLDSDERLAIAQTIAQGGAKWKVNLIVSTQKPTQSNLPDLLNQLGNRFVGKCANAQTSVLLTGHAGLQAHKLTPGGDFLHVNGSIERFQVAMPVATDFEKLPHSEIVWPEIEEEDTPRILNFPTFKEEGRPATEIEPRKVYHYWRIGPDNISISQAEKIFGLKRRGHEKHRAFVLEMIDEKEKFERSQE